jgi:hypothetical protein
MESYTEELTWNMDCMGAIFDCLKIDDKISLSMVNKTISGSINNTKLNVSGKKIGPYTLRPQQYITCMKIDEKLKKEQLVVLGAPMGFGKTLTTIYYIDKFACDDTVLIVVPPAVIGTWIAELNKVGYLDSDPSKSKVLVNHTCRPKHKLFFDSSNPFKNNRIILTTTKSEHKVAGNIDLTIYDEYHNVSMFFIDDKKILGLTGEIGTIHNLKNAVIAGINLSEKIPSIKFKWWYVENGMIRYETYGQHIVSFEQYKKNYKNNLLSYVSSVNKTVICVDKGEIGKEIRGWIKDDLPDYKIYEHVGSTKVLDTFAVHKGKAVLFIGSKKNEGLNILVENMIIVNPDIMSCTRIRQTIARLMRPNNPHKTVNINFLVGGKIGLLKSYYASCYANIDWTFSFEKYPVESLLYKSASIAMMLGYKRIIDLPNADGCVIFDNVYNKERCQSVLEWWKKHKSTNSVLTPELIESLYNV